MNSTFSSKISEKEVELIYKYMNSHIVSNNNQYVKYFFKTKNYTITIYNNLNCVIQGYGYENILKMLKNKPKISDSNEVKDDEEYIGSDESGTGDFFGGIVVAAANAPKENFQKIRDLGVMDSKLLSNSDIYRIIPALKNLCSYEIYLLECLEYNEMYEKYQNVNTIKSYMHQIVDEKLSEKLKIKKVVIDQFTPLKNHLKHIKIAGVKNTLELFFYTKAENKFLNVAIASIFARWTFLEHINQLSIKCNYKIPLGAVNSLVVPIAHEVLKDREAKELVKTHFKTMERINFK